jgi:hypothetical protein
MVNSPDVPHLIFDRRCPVLQCLSLIGKDQTIDVLMPSAEARTVLLHCFQLLLRARTASTSNITILTHVGALNHKMHPLLQAKAQHAEQEAVTKAQEARIIGLAGQEAGDLQHCMMGAYVLMEGKLVGGRCVWQREGAGLEAYIYYAETREQWYVCTKAEMESGEVFGVVCVTPGVTSNGKLPMTPDAATEQWQVFRGVTSSGVFDRGAWPIAPKITARRVSLM